ncbi:hypothetical protein, partial [Pseudomonas aeruginosa]
EHVYAVLCDRQDQLAVPPGTEIRLMCAQRTGTNKTGALSTNLQRLAAKKSPAHCEWRALSMARAALLGYSGDRLVRLDTWRV